MADVVQALGDALNKDMQAISQIAQNLANVNTPGYKASSMVTGQIDFSQSVLGRKSIPQVNESQVMVYDFKNGALKQSERSLDVAISGNAFFKTSFQGQEVYTRNGSLKINDKGVLVTSLGFPLISDSGDVNVNQSTSIKIAADGRVLQNDTLLATLELVSFDNLQLVEHLGGGLLATSKTNVKPAESWVIHQGYIEASNVNTSQEMVRMMELSKHFESVQKALSIYDQALSNGINRIGQ